MRTSPSNEFVFVLLMEECNIFIYKCREIIDGKVAYTVGSYIMHFDTALVPTRNRAAPPLISDEV